MQRRLNLACALIHRPRLLLLDEPTVNLDPQSRHRLLGAIEELKRDGLTVLLSTNLIDEAARACDRVVIIDRGRTLATGAKQELLDHYGCSDLQALLLSLTGKELRD
jgi:ABC-2 type transport system ATP-binding protein